MKSTLNLDDYTSEELVMMNHLICREVERRHAQLVRKELSGFQICDRVYFEHPDGHTCHGTVERVNQKSVSVRTDDNRRWRVAAGLVKKETKKVAKMPNNLVSLRRH